jgi:hypothetical protein
MFLDQGPRRSRGSTLAREALDDEPERRPYGLSGCGDVVETVEGVLPAGHIQDFEGSTLQPFSMAPYPK